MKKGMASLRKVGFTLIEVLVTVVVIGVLAAVVIPAVTSQVSAGDSARVFNDLTAIRTGIENFDIAVKQYPGDIDDLVNQPSLAASPTTATTDRDIAASVYVSNTAWAGPYVEAVLPTAATSSTVASPSVVGFNTGYSGTVNNQFASCSVSAAAVCTTTGGNYITVLVNALTASQALTVNDLIDGIGETASATAGKWRVFSDAVSSTGYFYAAPYK